MKSKFTKILGVGLSVAVLLSLLVMASPSAPASAGVGTLRFDIIPLPKFGSAGNFVLQPNTDLGPIAFAPSGNVTFASANLTTANITDVLKSSDGGYTWTQQTGFRTAAVAASDNSSILDIEVSPQFATDGTVFVATSNGVYQSIDGGVTFTQITAAATLGGGNITNIDIALDSTSRLGLLIGTSTGSYGGNVWAYIPATTGLVYRAQGLSGVDVLAVAFSPKFASDGGIFCVAVDASGNTTFRASFGWTATGGGWGAAIGNATFRDPYGAALLATRARIAFPDDFTIGSLTSNIAFAGLVVGSPEGTTAEKGDLFKVTLSPLTSAALDLNVRGVPGVLTPSATNIWTVAVKGNAAAASILVGTNFWAPADYLGTNYWTAYYSLDSGVTWANAREKSPTGGGTGAMSGTVAGINTYVALAGDFATSKVALAATSDGGYQTSAVSRTADGGKSWNQISLIDYADATNAYYVTSISAVHPYATSNSLWMMTKAGTGYALYGSLWKTTNGGQTYERIFSYANPTATNNFYSFTVLATNLFIVDYTNGRFWKSTDATAASWPTIISAPGAGLSGVTIRDANTIWLGQGGSIWSTTNAGLTWVKPTTSLVTSALSSGFAFSGTNVIVASAYAVYISTDSGVNFASKLGVADPGYSYVVGFDPAFATNKFVYCNSVAGGPSGNGVYRIAVSTASPTSTAWERIDANATFAPGYTTVSPVVGFDLGGVYYVWDYATVNATADTGGIWRSTNPRDATTAVYPPQWEKFRLGLADGTALNYAGYSYGPNIIFGLNRSGTTTVAYYNQLVAMMDTLATGATLDTPADKAANVGISETTESLTLAVSLSWKAMTGATMYHVQVANDAAFVSKVTEFSTSALTQQLVEVFLSGRTYYWRVRVGSYNAANGMTSGAPLISPWSTARSFTTGVPYALELKIISPAVGSSGVSVTPTFTWTAVPGVTTYELVVSEDSTFAIIDFSRTADKAMFQTDEALAYKTTYYWRVRPAGGTWVYGVFTTEAKPVPTSPPITITQTQPPPITITVPTPVEAVPKYLLWIIIAIGAVLVIALIVLIIRTRRAA